MLKKDVFYVTSISLYFFYSKCTLHWCNMIVLPALKFSICVHEPISFYNQSLVISDKSISISIK